MKILVTSDWHLEFHYDYGKAFLDELSNPEIDVLVVAGDLCLIHDLHKVLKQAAKMFPHIVFVLGNHEYYHSSFPKVWEAIDKIKRDISLSQTVHLLDSDTSYGIEIEGKRFIGDTLWFKPHSNDDKIKHMMSDFEVIENLAPQVYLENKAACKMLAGNIQEGDIVVTHHMPSFKSTPDIYKNSLLNNFFVCEMDDIIKETKPALWIHGHTHTKCDYQLFDTRVVCNPFGYLGREQCTEDFDWNKVIEI